MTRFTLRDMFWLTLVVGLGCAWWIERAALRDEVESARYRLQYWPSQPGEKLEVELDENGTQTITRTRESSPAFEQTIQVEFLHKPAN